MSTSTGIQWTDATWNPVRGCSMAKGSEAGGCLNCYAARQAARNFPGMRSPTTGEAFAVLRDSGPRWTGKVELIESALGIPLRWKKPRRVFVNSMSDLFHEGLSYEAIRRIFWVMDVCQQHTFQILTKRGSRLLEIVARIYADMDCILPNVWLGVSVENQATADERIPLLLQTPAAVRFVSYEPALGPVDFTALQPNREVEIDALNGHHGVYRPLQGDNTKLDWIIVGGESGPKARPFDIQWAHATIAQCRTAGVPVFVKQLGGNPFNWGFPELPNSSVAPLHDKKGGDWGEWPNDLKVRQFPEDRQRRTDIPKTHAGGTKGA